MQKFRKPWSLIVSLAFFGIFAAHGAQTIRVKVPGGELKGKVKSINDKEVVLILKSGVEQPIPIQFLTREQVDRLQGSMVDPTDAKALFELAQKCYLNGQKNQAYELFQKIGALDASYRAKIADLIRGKIGKRAKKVASKNEPFTLRSVDEVHTEIYYQYAPAVVGLNCKIKSNDKLQYVGTGAVISPQGLILTSSTVIPEDAYEIKVYFTDGHVRSAELKQFHKESEGVLIQLTDSLKGLPFMKLAHSDKYKPGEPVYSWGNPHNSIPRDGTVSLSLGQLSGQYNVSSADDQSRYIGPVIETDAAVNPGSDGGPLTDAEGNLLGIMSLAFSPSRWLGLVIPTTRLVEGIPELKALEFGAKPQWTNGSGKVWARQLALQDAAIGVEPSVVGLWVVRQGDTQKPPANRKEEELSERKAFPRGRMRAMFERARPSGSCCSGIIVEADGTVITSAFNIGPIVSRARNPRDPRKIITKKRSVVNIFAYLADGTRVPAKVLGQNGTYDLAVLKLQGKRKTYPYTKLAKSSNLVSGSSLALLGRSESPGNATLNIGSVSAANRESGLCAQISTLMNYGNLGGAVIDIQGNLVGMASHLNSTTSWRQSCGVGFCLLSEKIDAVLADLKAGKKIKVPARPYIGISFDFNSNETRGVAVKSVENDSPASKAGLKAGDVITDFNGQEAEDQITVINMVAACKIGATVQVKILRGDTPQTLPLVIGVKK